MVLLNVDVDCDVKLSPVVLVLSVAIQAKVEEIVAFKGKLTVPPLQIVELAELVIEGKGLTVTATDWDAPVQPPDEEVGLTV